MADSELAVTAPELRARCLRVLREVLAMTDNFWAAMHAAEGLTQLGHADEVVSALVPRLLAEPEEKRKCGLARELARAGDTARIGVLTAALADRNGTARVQAAESLFKLGVPGDRGALLSALDDGDVVLGLMAAAALIRLGESMLLSRVRARLAAEDPVARRIAVWVVGQLGDAEDLPTLASMRPHEAEPLAGCFLVDAMARLGSADALRAVAGNLADDDQTIRAYAAQTLGEVGQKIHLPALAERLMDPDSDVRARAAHSAIAISLRELP